jgi:hypothetical protein
VATVVAVGAGEVGAAGELPPQATKRQGITSRTETRPTWQYPDLTITPLGIVLVILL